MRALLWLFAAAMLLPEGRCWPLRTSMRVLLRLRLVESVCDLEGSTALLAAPFAPPPPPRLLLLLAAGWVFEWSERAVETVMLAAG